MNFHLPTSHLEAENPLWLVLPTNINVGKVRKIRGKNLAKQDSFFGGLWSMMLFSMHDALAHQLLFYHCTFYDYFE